MRWWWLSGPFTNQDIARQLAWVAGSGFGGVELAWIDPSWLDELERSAPRPAFLSQEWSDLVAFAKMQASASGLSCDFTFGSAWPFGGTWVSAEDGAQTFDGISGERLRGSWEAAAGLEVRVVNHLSSSALRDYAGPLLAALAPAIAGDRSALFCDSLEIATERLWSSELWNRFAEQFGYRLEPFLERLDGEPDVRYDYRKLRGEVMLKEFYQTFVEICHSVGADARVQCHGAPTDLLTAYAAVDIPESEALLFAPEFSRIAASAAAWAGRNIVSAEAFTCLHGFPGWDDSADELWQEETAGDLKLLGDALFANGVNQLVWHGMPYRPEGGEQEFYAAVHVGPDSPFAPQLPALNEYFATACRALRQGKPVATVGLWLPFEDGLMKDHIAEDERTPGANFEWEMRKARQSADWFGFAPLWISHSFLREAEVVAGGAITSRHSTVQAVAIDCEWLDADSLRELVRLAKAGGRVICKGIPKQPGYHKNKSFQQQLMSLNTNGPDLAPLLMGEKLPPYQAREMDGDLQLFFAHPAVDLISYPMKHRLFEEAVPTSREVLVRWAGREVAVALPFGLNDPVLLRISPTGAVSYQALPRHNEICEKS